MDNLLENDEAHINHIMNLYSFSEFSKNQNEKKMIFEKKKIFLNNFLENLEKKGMIVKKENMFHFFVVKHIYYNVTNKYLYWKTTFYKKRLLFIHNIKNLYKLNIYKNKNGFYIKMDIYENKENKYIYFSFQNEDEQNLFYESILTLLSILYLI